ncbi:hypothetical protein [Acrocarpospora sp. B8E8]|uniref:hypothetical protein n=1 Tax=Acrocarpospora sp. B8E8 TaxID=3153572 RepID=UPI00325FD3A0
MLLLVGFLVPATAHADEPAPRTADVQVELQGVRLTPAQAEALRRAAAAHPGLTREQAAKIAPTIGLSRTNAEGRGESRGPCGVARLWGDSYGHYRFGLEFRTEVVGTAAVGGVGVSTNSPIPNSAGRHSYGVSGSYVGNDRPGNEWRTLSSIGWGATATTLDGWALTTGWWFCGIAVRANWKW